MPGCFGVKGNNIGSRLGEVRNNAVNRLDHQMDIDNRLGQGTDRFTHERANGEIGHVVIIHHIKMDDIRT